MTGIQQPAEHECDGWGLHPWDCGAPIETAAARRRKAEAAAAPKAHDCHRCERTFTTPPVHDPIEVHCGGTRNATTWCSTECYAATQNDLEARL